MHREQVRTNDPLEMSQDDIWRIARRQKWMVVSFLFSFLFTIASVGWLMSGAAANGTVAWLLYVISAVFAFVFYVALTLLAQKLHGTGMAVVTLLASVLVPLVAMVAIFVLSVQANRTLKARDVKTGLLGADMSQFGHPA